MRRITTPRPGWETSSGWSPGWRRSLTDIYNQNGDLVCDGTVVLGFIHSDTRRPTRIPAALLEVFRKADQEAGQKA